MPKLKIIGLSLGILPTNCYVIKNTENNECIVVDPCDGLDSILSAIGDSKCVAILLTHGHFDHIGLVDVLVKRFDIPFYIHPGDVEKLDDPTKNGSASYGIPIKIFQKPKLIEEGDKLTLAGIDIEVIHTPGHSKGCVCFILPEDQGILCGDTLFEDGYGRTDFYDGDFAAMKQSLRRLYFYPKKVIAYPGHGKTTFAGKDKE